MLLRLAHSRHAPVRPLALRCAHPNWPKVLQASCVARSVNRLGELLTVS